MNRKAFLTTLGAAGVGVVAAARSTPVALAQEDENADSRPNEREHLFEEALAHHKEVYAQFTAALADELGVSDGDEVDAAIRKAIMTVIDAQRGDDVLTYGQAEALKTLVATADVPIVPGFIHGPLLVATMPAPMEGEGPGFGDHIFVRPKGPCDEAPGGGD